MLEFEDRIAVDVGADEAFAFVTDFSRMPQYIPTVKFVEPTRNERIRMRGTVAGRAYDAEGEFHADPATRCMEWSSEVDRSYHGWLEVKQNGAKCVVIVHLSFDVAATDKMESHGVDPATKIKGGIRDTLVAVRDRLERRSPAGDPPHSDPAGRGSHRGSGSEPHDS